MYDATSKINPGDKVRFFGHPESIRLVVETLHYPSRGALWIMAYREDQPDAPEYLLSPKERGDTWQKLHA